VQGTYSTLNNTKCYKIKSQQHTNTPHTTSRSIKVMSVKLHAASLSGDAVEKGRGLASGLQLRQPHVAAIGEDMVRKCGEVRNLPSCAMVTKQETHRAYIALQAQHATTEH
jgi:hypothetical protein